MTKENEIVSMLETLLTRQGLSTANLNASAHLYEEGIGLDSLGAAELSAMLETQYGKDPYTAGQVPQYVSDLVSFYENP